jgi:hypothetical protein
MDELAMAVSSLWDSGRRLTANVERRLPSLTAYSKLKWAATQKSNPVTAYVDKHCRLPPTMN